MNNLKHPLVKQHSSIDYRIGDGFYALSGDSDFRNKTFKEYPNTILTDYLSKTNQCRNYDTLLNIIKNKSFSLPHNCPFRDNYIIIHLRIGDIMDSLSNDMFNKKAFHDQDSFNNSLPKDHFFYNATKYIVPLDWYPNLLHYFHNTNILIIAASHVNLGNYNNSNKYIQEVKNRLSKNGNTVFTMLGSHPDNDLLSIKNCKEFIRGSGNYSKLLSELSVKLGIKTNCHPKVLEYWG